ncbi:unnamed protein product, partial [Didymodactylos carnosus]
MIHGGWWCSAYNRSIEISTATDLINRGIPVWNIDYRSRGNGGGWPNTFYDVGNATDLLVSVANQTGLSASKTIVTGHSAGGELSLWAASRFKQPDGAPGANPVWRPIAAVSQAGALDMVDAYEKNLGNNAVYYFLGCAPAQCPTRYQHTSPTTLVPLGIPTLVVSGYNDTVVPYNQAQLYNASAVRAHDNVTTYL